ncbi:MAG: ABC transporter ATP-binding protein [Polyangiales bacterium]
MKKTYIDPQNLPTVEPETMRRIVRFLRPYLRSMLAVAALIGAGALLHLAPPMCIERIVDEALPQRRFTLLYVLCAGMVVGPLIAGFMQVAQKVLTATVAERVQRDLRVQLFEHLHEQPVSWFASAAPGEAISRVLNDVAGAGSAVSGTLVDFIDSTLALVSTAALLLWLDWRLALVAFAMLPAFVIPTRSVGMKRKKLKRQAQVGMAELTGILSETLSISGALLLKVSGTERREVDRLKAKADDVMALSIKQTQVGRWFQMILGLFETFGPALVFAVGGTLVLYGHARLGTLVAFTTLLKRLYGPARALAGVRTDVITSYAYFERIFSFLDMRAAIVDAPDARDVPALEGAITFENVCLTAGEHEILKDVSLEIKPGEVLALVGSSGAGKSTLAALVPRLWDPTSGAVRIDGVDLRKLKAASVRKHIGVVTQETILFQTSVLENIRYGTPDATREDVERAARAAQIHETIMAMPDGYETLVGDRGYRLSGGERQRVAIARAILKNPKILILDEATSSLDAHNERLVQDALEPLLEGRTVLVITHRLATVRHADRIVLMERGRLVEEGTHLSLLRARQRYAELAAEQGLTIESESPGESAMARA